MRALSHSIIVVRRKTKLGEDMKMSVNGVTVSSETKIAYAANPKRVGSKAYDRYEAYKSATTIGEYFSITKPYGMVAKADLRWDHDRKFLTIVVE